MTGGDIPTGILKFEGELTPEQVAMWRALWEAATDLSEPEGFRVWKAGVAHGRATERERLTGQLRKILANNVVWPQALADALYGLLDGAQ